MKVAWVIAITGGITFIETASEVCKLAFTTIGILSIHVRSSMKYVYYVFTQSNLGHPKWGSNPWSPCRQNV